MTGSSIADYLPVVQPHLDEALVSQACREQIKRVASQLPSEMTSLFGFECRLRAAVEPVDFCVRVRPVHEELDVLADRRPDARLPQAFWAEPVWRQTRDFCRAVADPACVLHNRITSVWLEFDMDEPSSVVPIPCVFFGSGHIRSTGADAAGLPQGIVREAFRLLTGSDISGPQERALMSCVRCLPSGSNIFVLGIMAARVPPFVRVAVAGLGQGRITPYLDAVGWPGDTGEIDRLAAELSPLADRVDLNLDAGHDLGARASLECSFVPKRSPADEPRWHALLGYLVDSGLCTEDGRQALLRYPGLDREGVAIARDLFHVKVVYEPGRPLEAKAYLCARRV